MLKFHKYGRPYTIIWRFFFIISDPDFTDLLNNSASGVNLVSDKMKFCKWIRQSDIFKKRSVNFFFRLSQIYWKIKIVL